MFKSCNTFDVHPKTLAESKQHVFCTIVANSHTVRGSADQGSDTECGWVMGIQGARNWVYMQRGKKATEKNGAAAGAGAAAQGVLRGRRVQ